LNGRRAPKREPRALSSLKMKDTAPGCLQRPRSKFLKVEISLNQKQESMPQLSFWRKSKLNNLKKKRRQENQSIGLMVSSLYPFISHRVDLTIKFYLLGRTVRACPRNQKSVDRFMFMTFCLILRSPNFQFSAVKLKKYW
jgi:hypothetical protein